MKLTHLVLIVVGLLLLNGVLGATASATTVLQCRMQLAHLRDAEVKTAAGGHSDGVAMLDNASLQMTDGRNTDAVQTLTDFVAQGHASIGVQDLINCINSIGTPYTPPVGLAGVHS